MLTVCGLCTVRRHLAAVQCEVAMHHDSHDLPPFEARYRLTWGSADSTTELGFFNDLTEAWAACFASRLATDVRPWLELRDFYKPEPRHLPHLRDRVPGLQHGLRAFTRGRALCGRDDPHRRQLHAAKAVGRL